MLCSFALQNLAPIWLEPFPFVPCLREDLLKLVRFEIGMVPSTPAAYACAPFWLVQEFIHLEGVPKRIWIVETDVRRRQHFWTLTFKSAFSLGNDVRGDSPRSTRAHGFLLPVRMGALCSNQLGSLLERCHCAFEPLAKPILCLHLWISLAKPILRLHLCNVLAKLILCFHMRKAVAKPFPKLVFCVHFGQVIFKGAPTVSLEPVLCFQFLTFISLGNTKTGGSRSQLAQAQCRQLCDGCPQSIATNRKSSCVRIRCR